jgi:putative ABC transport system ATP-binding protein
VIFDDVPLHKASEEKLARIRNRSVGFIFQSFQLLPSLTALENVMVPAEISGERLVRGSALELLGRVGLGKRLHHYPAELSGGEQQRVAIARAFMNGPKILFADEPTGNLDVETAQSVIKLIFDLNASIGTTMILVTHDRELTQMANRVISLRGGKVVGDSPNPAEPTVPATALT